MNAVKTFYCLTGLVFSATVIVAQPQANRITETDDFLAVTNSMHKAVAATFVRPEWMLPEQEAKWRDVPKECFRHIKLLFDLMSLIPASKVEMICFKYTCMSHEGILSFWVTDDAVYRITIPHFLEDSPLSIAKTVRATTFNTELDAFESVPLTKYASGGFDVPRGFYVRRTLDGTFESIYFPAITKEFPDTVRPEKARDLTKDTRGSPEKIIAFDRLLQTFDELMGKPVLWSNGGVPRTVTK